MAKETLLLNELYEKCLKSLEDKEDSDIKEEYIRDFFETIIDDFNNLNKKSILIFSERDTKIIRTRYGLYSNNNIVTVKKTAKINNISEKVTEEVLRKFRQYIRECSKLFLKRITDQINSRKTQYDFIHKEIAELEELGLSDRLYEKIHNILKINTLNELINIPENKLYKMQCIKEYEVEGIKKLLHSIDLKFGFELKNDIEKRTQQETIERIKKLGLAFIKKRKGNPKYELTMIEELDLEKITINKLNKNGVTKIKDLTILNHQKLSEILNSSSELNKVISELKKLGLKLSNGTSDERIVLKINEETTIETFDVFIEIKKSLKYNKSETEQEKIEIYFNNLKNDFYNIDKKQILDLPERIITYLRMIYGLYNEYENQPLEEIAKKYGYTITKNQIEKHIYKYVNDAINKDICKKPKKKTSIEDKTQNSSQEISELRKKLKKKIEDARETEKYIRLLQNELNEKNKEIEQLYRDIELKTNVK